MATDERDYELEGTDEWEDYDPDRDEFPEDELDGFEVYDSADEYLARYVRTEWDSEDE